MNDDFTCFVEILTFLLVNIFFCYQNPYIFLVQKKTLDFFMNCISPFLLSTDEFPLSWAEKLILFPSVSSGLCDSL